MGSTRPFETRIPGRRLALLTSACLAACAPRAATPPARDGVLDLRAWDPARDGPARADGDWRFAWGTLDDAVPPDGPGSTIAVPGPWEGRPTPGGPAPARGTATYGLRVLLPADAGPLAVSAGGASSAWRLLVGGEVLCGSGVVSATPDEVVPSLSSRICALPPQQDAVELVVQVANVEHRRGGMRRSWLIGSTEGMTHAVMSDAARDAGLTLFLVVVGLHHLLFFAGRPSERSRLWFGLASVVVGLRVLLAGASDLLHVLAPGLPWGLQLRAEYVAVSAVAALGGLFVADLFPEVRWRLGATALVRANLALVLLFALAPIAWIFPGLYVALGLALATLLVLLVQTAQAAAKGLPLAWHTLVGIVALMLGFLVDSVTTVSAASLSAGWFPYTAVGLVAIETYGLTRDFSRSYTTIAQLGTDLMAANEDLSQTNEATRRFVPTEFLELLGRRSIVGVVPGEHVATHLSVLFCDIRSFTPLVESLGPAAAFDFINAWLGSMEPAIHRHRGFIDSYLGDGIMALFPGGADAAVRAGVDMLLALDGFNAAHAGHLGVPLSMGIGVNAGSIMLGTIGGGERLDVGVVGDAVNLASRIEGMTRIYGARFLVSGAVQEGMSDPDGAALRELDLVIAKGKTQPIRIFEVLDALPDDERQARLASRDTYADALAAWRRGAFADARDGFRRCLEIWPADGAARLLLSRCEPLVGQPTPADWTGAWALDRK